MKLTALFAALLAVLAGGTLPAAMVEYAIDPARSFVTVLGAYRVDSFQPVRPGSSTNDFVGSFFGAIDGDALDIEGGNPTDREYGSEQPPVPPYELVAETFEGPLTLSILSIQFSAASAFGEEPISISSGKFAGHLVRFFIGGGTLVFQGFGSPSQQIDLHGKGAPNITQREGTIITENGVQTITVPVDLAVPFSLREENDTILTFSGQFVATGAIPEPSSGLILIFGAIALLSRARNSVTG